MFLFMLPAYAGGLKDGELFGHKLGEVYVPKVLQSKNEEQAKWERYDPLFLDEAAKNMGLVSFNVLVYPDNHKAFKISGISGPLTWHAALEAAEDAFSKFDLEMGFQNNQKPLLEELRFTILQTFVVHKIILGDHHNLGLTITLQRTPETGNTERHDPEFYNFIVDLSYLEKDGEYCDSLRDNIATENKIYRVDYGRCEFFYDE